jgi:hypothetical protein
MKSSIVVILFSGMALTACGGSVRTDEAADDGMPAASLTETTGSSAEMESAQQASAAAARVNRRTPSATRTILHRSSTIFEGQVADISHTYDEQLGPRMVATVQVTNVRSGQDVGPIIELAQFGGEVPGEGVVSASDTVWFQSGQTYLFFLSNQAWHFTPWVAEPLLVGDDDLLVGPSGRVVAGLDPRGVSYGARLQEVTSAAAKDAASNGRRAFPILRKSQFFELLDEAMTVEGIRPSGSFTRAPKPVGKEWRRMPVTPLSSDSLQVKP